MCRYKCMQTDRPEHLKADTSVGADTHIRYQERSVCAHSHTLPNQPISLSSPSDMFVYPLIPMFSPHPTPGPLHWIFPISPNALSARQDAYQNTAWHSLDSHGEGCWEEHEGTMRHQAALILRYLTEVSPRSSQGASPYACLLGAHLQTGHPWCHCISRRELSRITLSHSYTPPEHAFTLAYSCTHMHTHTIFFMLAHSCTHTCTLVLYFFILVHSDIHTHAP